MDEKELRYVLVYSDKGEYDEESIDPICVAAFPKSAIDKDIDVALLGKLWRDIDIVRYVPVQRIMFVQGEMK